MGIGSSTPKEDFSSLFALLERARERRDTELLIPLKNLAESAAAASVAANETKNTRKFLGEIQKVDAILYELQSGVDDPVSDAAHFESLLRQALQRGDAALLESARHAALAYSRQFPSESLFQCIAEADTALLAVRQGSDDPTEAVSVFKSLIYQAKSRNDSGLLTPAIEASKAFLRQLPSTELMRCVEEAQETLKTLTDPEAFEPYDVIVRLTNLAEFVRLKEVPVLQRAGSTFDVTKNTRCRVVAIAGFFNKGKTWLINKLFGRNLGSSKTMATEGMSFVHLEQENILVMDTQGLQSPVDHTDECIEDALVQMQHKESLLFDLQYRLAQYVVFVVNDLTWSEQAYVSALHNKISAGHHAKRCRNVIVVHNLRGIPTPEGARKLFKHQIMSRYAGAEPKRSDGLVYVSEVQAGGRGVQISQIRHIGLCEDGTEAGDWYNPKNVRQIFTWLNELDPIGQEVALAPLIAKELEPLLTHFVQVEATGTDEGRGSMPFTVSYCSHEWDVTPSPLEGYEVHGSVSIETGEGTTIRLKAKGVVSELGEILTEETNFDPDFSVVDIEGGAYRMIEVECPGVKSTDVTIRKMPQGVEVRIEKKRSFDPSKVSVARGHALQTNKYGEWKKVFMFRDEDWFTYEHGKTSLRDGVLRVYLGRHAEPQIYTISQENGDETESRNSSPMLLSPGGRSGGNG